MSTPSIVTRPVWGSYSRATRYPSVVLPEPVSPTIAVRVPAGTTRSMSRSVQSASSSGVRVRAGVAERDVLEPDLAEHLAGTQRHRVRCLGDVDRQVEVLEDAVEQRQR